MHSEPVLSIQNLSVWYRVYGGYLKVVNGIDMEVFAGEKVALVGETGCGKTTSMKAVMRLLPLNARVPGGKILFRGDDVLAMGKREVRRYRRQGLSMIFQDPTASLNPVFTVGSQISEVVGRYDAEGEAGAERRYGAEWGKGAAPSRKRVRELSLEVLRKVALPDPVRIMKSYPFQLSGGMRQRICIALALSTAQALLIADEPTTSLDVTIQSQIIDLIGTLVEERKTSLILITHSLGVAREVTERIHVMYAGTIIEVARTSELYERPLHPYTRGLLTSVPRLTGGGFADGIPGRIPEYLHPPEGCRFHPRCPKVMDVCRTERPPFYTVDGGGAAGGSGGVSGGGGHNAASFDHRVACFLYREE